MSIDRIGKPNGLSGATPAEPGDLAPLQGNGGETFTIHEAAPPQPTSSLEQLRAGEITLSRYLDQKVEAATQHLAGRLPPEQLEFIHQSLRDQLASDPVLVDLVKATSGSTPPIDE